MGLVGYIKNKVYALIAFFFGVEMFITGVGEKSDNLMQYIMLLGALLLILVGIYYFRKRTDK